MNSTLTEQDILDSIEKLGLPDRPPADPFGIRSFMGMNVYTTPPDPPKLKLSANAKVSPKFRADFDAWLLERFGTQDPLLPKGSAFMLRSLNTLITRPEDAATLAYIGA